MDALTLSVLVAAAGVALVHTALGPDHYLPFLFLARARGWSLRRTLAVTAACGAGHVGSSLLLGFGGLALGYEIARLAGIEAIRGDVAAWALVAFGMAYGIWGVRRALRTRKGIVPHDHGGDVHVHLRGDVAHGHGQGVSATTFWSLFLIFVLGPCEPLIPLFVVPLSEGNLGLAWATAAVFSLVTIAAMLVLVGLATFGLERLPFVALERWSHAMAGGVVAGCGLSVLFLGL